MLATDISVADELAAELHIGRCEAVHHSTRNLRVGALCRAERASLTGCRVVDRLS
jgi:hypothetical protein